MAIKLYDLAAAEDDRRFSPYCWRVKMALKHKGLDFETIPWRFTEKDAPDNWNYWVVPANMPGKPLVHEHVERICVENNGPFGGGAVGVPFDGPVIAR